MITLLINAHEGRDVAIAGVMGAYLLATMDDFIVEKVDGTSADIMCKVNPTFSKYLTKGNSKNTLHLQLTRAII